MARLLGCLVSLLLLLPPMAEATVLVDLHSSEGKLDVRLVCSGDTLLNDDQGQPWLTAADQLLCTLIVTAPEDMQVNLPSFAGQSFGDFTLLDQGEGTIRRTSDGLEHLRQWIIEPYNPGPYQLPELLVRAHHADMTIELILPRPELSVHALETTSKDLDDILPPQAPAPPMAAMLTLAALTLVSIALAVWLFIRHKSKGPRPLPPKERALAEIALIGDLPPREQVERLALILRCYLNSRFALRCLEQTYDEYAQAIADCTLIPKESRDIFLAVLKRCDLIKFSNISPEPGETEEYTNQIKEGLAACPLAKPDDKTCGRW